MKSISQRFKRSKFFGAVLYLLLFIFLTLPVFFIIPAITSNDSIALFGMSEILVILTLFIVFCLLCLSVSMINILNLNLSTALIFFSLVFLIVLASFSSIFYLNLEIRNFLSHAIFLSVFLLLIFYIATSTNITSTIVPYIILFFYRPIVFFRINLKRGKQY